MPRRVTINDVASEAGVSISTVSVALNGREGVSEQTRRRIITVAESIGWVPSLGGRSLSQGRAFAVGMVLRRNPKVVEADPFFAGFIGGVESVLERQGYALVLQLATSRQRMVERYRLLAQNRRIDGVFLTDLLVTDPRIRLLADLEVPTVAVNPSRGSKAFPAVRQDHVPGLRDLMAYLVSLGHERIAHVRGKKGFIHTLQREQGWQDGLSAAGIPPGPISDGDFTLESGARAADQLMTSYDRPTAVMCANDLMAIGFIGRASAMGFAVPQDVSVTGYDGIQLGEFTRPRLTTLTTSPHDLGREAAKLLLACIDGDQVSDVDISPAALRIRDSVAPPR